MPRIASKFSFLLWCVLGSLSYLFAALAVGVVFCVSFGMQVPVSAYWIGGVLGWLGGGLLEHRSVRH